MVKAIAAAFAMSILLAGCQSSALRHARAKHPGCEVEPVAEVDDAVRVVIRCPGSEPVERVYRER